MRRILIGILVNSLALYAVSLFIAEMHYTGGIKFFLIGGFIIGLLNLFVKPLMKLLSMPLMILTIGLFSIVINAIIFWLTMKIVNGIHVSEVSVQISGVMTYLLAAIIFGISNWLIHILIKNK